MSGSQMLYTKYSLKKLQILFHRNAPKIQCSRQAYGKSSLKMWQRFYSQLDAQYELHMWKSAPIYFF